MKETEEDVDIETNNEKVPVIDEKNKVPVKQVVPQKEEPQKKVFQRFISKYSIC